MRRSFLLATVFALIVATPSFAALKVPTPQLKVIPLSPTVSTNLSAGDEVQQMITAAGNIFLIGTLETTSSSLITSQPLGDSDGFIVALGPTGAHLWDVRLGTAGDDVATAGCVDASGNIWIVGSSAVSTATPAPGLNQLTLWEISSAGVLENTYSKSLSDVDIPTSIVQTGINFVVAGNSNKSGFPTFTLTVTPLGKITDPKNIVTPIASAPGLLIATSAAYIWQNFVTNKPIAGVTGIPSHQSTTVLIDSSLKTRALKSVFSIQGKPLALQYQVGIGVVALTQATGTYFLTIIHTK